MSYKVLLVYPRIDYKENYPCTWVPYAILSISKAIKNYFGDQIQVECFDYNHNKKSDFISLIKENVADILVTGFSIMTGGGQIESALELCEIVRKNSMSKIVFGGPHVNVMSMQTLEHEYVDDVLQGPGQTAFPLYVKYLLEKLSYKDVPGLISKRNGNYLIGSANNLTPSAMVGYDFTDIDLEPYIRKDKTISDRVLNYVSSQGCAYHCQFCYETSYKRKYCCIPDEIVTNDWKLFVKKYNISGLKLSDADWFINANRARRLMKTLKELGLSWSASIHPHDIIRDVSILDDIAAAGCTRLLMGIESGNDRILSQVVKKNITVKQIKYITEEISKRNIIGSYTFVVGFPSETEKEQNDTFLLVNNLWNLKPEPETKIHLYLPYPGTPLYGNAKDNAFLPPEKLNDWSELSYYETQMPWVSYDLVKKVALFTKLRFQEKGD